MFCHKYQHHMTPGTLAPMFSVGVLAQQGFVHVLRKKLNVFPNIASWYI